METDNLNIPYNTQPNIEANSVQQWPDNHANNLKQALEEKANLLKILEACQKELRDQKAEIFNLKQQNKTIYNNIKQLQEYTQKDLIDLKLFDQGFQNDNADTSSYIEDSYFLYEFLNEINKLDKTQNSFDKFTEPFIKINIQRLEDISNGLEVKYSINEQEVKEKVDKQLDADPNLNEEYTGSNYHRYLEEQIVQEINTLRSSASYVVGTIGNQKTGKSYLLSKISGQNIKQGHSVNTEGLNFLLKERRAPLYIDTQSYGEPIQAYKTLQTYRQYLENQKIQDELVKREGNQNVGPPKLNVTKQQEELQFNIQKELNCMNFNKNNIYDSSMIMEKFIKSFVLKISHVLILMVRQMTSDDENFIRQVMRIYNQNLCAKSLIIVHNFYHLTEIDEVKAQIEKNIKSCFPVEWIKQDQIDEDQYLTYCYYDFTVYAQRPVIHCVLAHEGTKAGDAFNRKTIELIKSQINQMNQQITYQKIEDRLCDFLTERFPQFLQPKAKQRIAQELNKIQEEIEKEVQKAAEECNQLDKYVQKQQISKELEEIQIRSRLNQGLYNFKTLYKPDFRNRKGQIICPLFAKKDKIDIIKNPSITTITGDDINPPELGIVKPDYFAINIKDNREMYFFFDLSSTNKISVRIGQKVTALGSQKYLAIEAVKQLPNVIKIQNEQVNNLNQILDIPTRISENGQRNILEGKISEKIRLFPGANNEFIWLDELKPISKLYPNGILQVMVKFRYTWDPDNSQDDDD